MEGPFSVIQKHFPDITNIEVLSFLQKMIVYYGIIMGGVLLEQESYQRISVELTYMIRHQLNLDCSERNMNCDPL